MNKPQTQNLSLKFIYRKGECFVFKCTKTNSVVVYNPHMTGHYFGNLNTTCSSKDEINDIEEASFFNKIQKVLPFIKERTLHRLISPCDLDFSYLEFLRMIDPVIGLQYNLEQKSTFGNLTKTFCLTEEEKYEICKNHMNEIVKEAYKEMIDLLY